MSSPGCMHTALVSRETAAFLDVVAEPGYTNIELNQKKPYQPLRVFQISCFQGSWNEFLIWMFYTEDFPGTSHRNTGCRIILAVFCRLWASLNEVRIHNQWAKTEQQTRNKDRAESNRVDKAVEKLCWSKRTWEAEIHWIYTGNTTCCFD